MLNIVVYCTVSGYITCLSLFKMWVSFSFLLLNHLSKVQLVDEGGWSGGNYPCSGTLTCTQNVLPVRGLCYLSLYSRKGVIIIFVPFLNHVSLPHHDYNRQATESLVLEV
jgi:hypothetical protein